jgi:RNA polymerase sigma-70 factor (ECF subfamily)
MTDLAWIEVALTAARPRVMSALLRYFRDLDTAEEAFQEACLRALKSWPVKGPPRDAAAWLVLVGRNAALDGVRHRSRERPLPDEAEISPLDDVETSLAERLDEGHYRDDLLRLLFVCCHPDLPDTQQIALALRIVSGLSVAEIARAFLVSDAAMEQRITRAKARIAKAEVPFEAPTAADRADRVARVAAMIYLVFNAGYSSLAAEAGERLCAEAIRLGWLLLRLFESEPEIMGLLALMLLQHARRRARADEAGEVILLDDQDRSLWDSDAIAEGLALIDKAMRHRAPGPYQIQAAIAALHARAARAEDTDWAQIEALYASLERHQPSPVVTLNRAVAVSKIAGPEAALDLIAPLEARLSGYFHYFGLKGALLLQLQRPGEAHAAFDRAIALAADPAQAAHIRGQLDRLSRDVSSGRAQNSTSRVGTVAPPSS